MKRLSGLLLSAALLLSLALGALPAYAEEATLAPAAPVGSSESFVTAENLTGVMDINNYTGAYVAKLKITDAEGFVRLSEIVNGKVEGISDSRALLVGQTVYLAADLDLSEVPDACLARKPIVLPVFSAAFGETVQPLKTACRRQHCVETERLAAWSVICRSKELWTDMSMLRTSHW